MAHPIVDRFRRGGLLFDGGLGSMLIAAGLETGWPPEEWNASRPDVVGDVHRAYLDAGAMVITTNTFGATRSRLNQHNLGDRTAELNAAGMRVAHEVVAAFNAAGAGAGNAENAGNGGERFAGASIGPGAGLMPPVGTVTGAQVRDDYTEQLSAIAGAYAPDMVLVETMLDVREALIALEVSRAVMPDVPVSVAMTYNKNPRGFFTVMGNEAADTTAALVDAGADVIAANCSIASDDMLKLARLLRGTTDAPLLCQPNAGAPAVRDGKAVYEQAPESFAADVVRLFEIGVNAVGGCCGTTPEFICAAAARVRGAGAA